MTPRPWEPGYKPPTAAEAFDESAPLPAAVLDTLAYLDMKDERIAELQCERDDYRCALEAIAAMNLHEVERYARDVAKAALAPTGRTGNDDND